MFALATDAYGELSGLRRIELPLPQPGAGEVRVRVQASALNPADYKVATGHMTFLHARNFPLVLGYDFSGTVDALGPDVSNLTVGAEIFGFLPYGPFNRRGAFAEMLIARSTEVAPKPVQVSHLQAAAAATPGVTALQSLRDLGRLNRPGMSVAITGVSGGVGSLAIAIAKKLGARVTAIGSGGGLALARELGADTVIDRKHADPLDFARGPFDIIFDAAAAYRWRQWRKHLDRRGAYITTLPTLQFAVDKLASIFGGPRAAFIAVKSRPEDLSAVAGWLSTGLKVHIDRTIGLAEVAQQLGRLRDGQVLGRVVVEIRN
jgi:NADPH:quinone reductase